MAESKITILDHHKQEEMCLTRPPYRQGKKLTAVKVYTINDESQHLLIFGVPSIGLLEDLRRICSKYGEIKEVLLVPDYAEEEFTETYHVCYSKIQSARYAKRVLDGRSFFGGVLHVCYAPELETVNETRAKLIQRRKDIASRTKGNIYAKRKGNRNSLNTVQPHQIDEQSSSATTSQGFNITVQTIKSSSVVLPIQGPQKPVNVFCAVSEDAKSSCSSSSFSHLDNSINYGSAQPTTSSRDLNFTSALKFIPRPVKVNRINFRDKRKTSSKNSDGITCVNAKEMSDSLQDMIHSVRKRIRMVSVPSVQGAIEKKCQITSNSDKSNC